MEHPNGVISATSHPLIKNGSKPPSLINPGVKVALPVGQTIWKPQSYLLPGALDCITSVDHIPSNFNRKIATNGPRIRVKRVGGSDHLPTSRNNVLTLPDHCHHRARDDVLHQPSEKRLRRQILIVLLSKRAFHGYKLQPFHVESFPLESGDDISDQAALDAVGLDHDEGLLHFYYLLQSALPLFLSEKCRREEDDLFFEALVSAPVDKFFRIVLIKEIKGSQFSVQLESAVRDRLAATDKYEEEEEAALEKISDFFQPKYLKRDSVISFYFPATSSTAEITIVAEGKGETDIKVENANVVEMIQKWFLGGSGAVSPSTVKNLSEKFEAILS